MRHDPQRHSVILNEKKPVSARIAVRIGKLFGGGPESWLRMQAAHDAWHAERTVDVSRIKTLPSPRRRHVEIPQ